MNKHKFKMFLIGVGIGLLVAGLYLTHIPGMVD